MADESEDESDIDIHIALRTKLKQIKPTFVGHSHKVWQLAP